jgi:hypothetical protein
VSNDEVVLIPAEKCCSCGLERASRGASQSHRLLKTKQAYIYWTLDLEEAENQHEKWPWSYKYIRRKFIIENPLFSSQNSESNYVEIYLKLDGEIVSEEAFEQAADDLKNASQPWFCQRCANKICDLCGWSTIYPGPCEVIDDAGRRVEIERLSLKPGCLNRGCENNHSIIETLPVGSEFIEHKPGPANFGKILDDQHLGDEKLETDLVSTYRIDFDKLTRQFGKCKQSNFIIISGWKTLSKDRQISKAQPSKSLTLRRKYLHQKNLAVHHEIVKRCRRVGINSFLLTGCWAKLGSADQGAREDALLLKKPAWFRNEDFLSVGIQLLEDFHQMFFLYGKLGKNKDQTLYRVDRNRELTELEIGTGDIERAYPLIRNRNGTSFQFSGIPSPSSFLSALMMRSLGYSW